MKKKKKEKDLDLSYLLIKVMLFQACEAGATVIFTEKEISKASSNFGYINLCLALTKTVGEDMDTSLLLHTVLD